MYDIARLIEPKTVDDAIVALTTYPDAKLIAGGSDVLIKLREGHMADITLISLYGLDALRGVCLDDDGTLRIGSLTSFSAVMNDPLIAAHLPTLAEAVACVGGPQIRNIGTLGGNTCNGVTSADSASTLLAYDADVEVKGPDGVRRIPLASFYVRPGVVALAPTEVQTALLIPRTAYEGYAGAYMKYAMRNAMDIATLGVSVNVKLDAAHTHLVDIRAAFGVAGPVPLRVPTAEQAVRGHALDRDLVRAFSDATLADVRPRTSWRATKSFRVHVIQTIARRALRRAIERAGGPCV